MEQSNSTRLVVSGDDGGTLAGWRYDVFLSFHGKDTRNNFTDHLYHALRNSGIYAFRDDKELPAGGVIDSTLQEAIESSKVLIVVFSKNYASSKWCLDELLHIMTCSKTNSRQLVFPIFHDIDPSDIRRQKGTVAEAFAKHEIHFQSDKLQSWKAALTEAANLAGWDLRNRQEAECIKDIVREILTKLDSSWLHAARYPVARYPVGVRSRVLEIYQLLSIGSDDVRVVGICGMGGIGKTTIARAAYNKFSNLFQGNSFLADIREHFEKPEGKIHLQQQLISDILKTQEVEFNSIDHAIKESFRRKKVLVIVDDVENLYQINSIIIDLSWFGPGSRIIVTTRNEYLLKQLQVNEIYFPETLDVSESLELLSWHAFGTSEPPEKFIGQSRNVVKYCGGLPLAVEVLGAFLFKRSLLEWESTLELLKRAPNYNIQAKLRISFDSLSNVQKDIFLDIACFFNGMDKEYVTHILDGCGFFPGIGLSVLMERCLVTETGNKLMMHDLIRDMGREIVREESPKRCGKRSRLWDPDEVIDVLIKCSGTDAVEGISLMKAQGLNVGKLNAKSFSSLRELRFLQLNHIQLEGNFEHLPKGLRSLCWHGFPLKFIPANFCLRSLAFMDMQCSNLRRLWKAAEAQPLMMLKFLDLSYSLSLKETPDFSYLKNLEKLLLIGCKRLLFVHKSIGIHCKKLVLVNLKGCVELEYLPSDFYRLKSLATLVLSDCSKLKKLDDALGEMEELETLLADGTAIREVPSSIVCLKKLKILSFCGSKGSFDHYMHSGKCPQHIRCLQVSIKGLTCLRTLRLSHCNLSDEQLPKDLSSLACLEELDLRANSFCNPQTDFTSLVNLWILQLDDCSKIQSITGLPRSLRYFYATNCISLERTPDLSECLFLQQLYLSNCINLVETPGLDKLKQSMLIHMEMCNRISDTFRESVLEGCAVTVSGGGGIFRRGSWIPEWFQFKDEPQYSFSFTVPETPHHLDLKGFTLYIHYIYCPGMSPDRPVIRVTNHTARRFWSCLSATLRFPLSRKEHLRVCHLPVEEFKLEKGDQVEVEVDFYSDEVIILDMGVSPVEAKDGNAVSLVKEAIAYIKASSNNKASISKLEHSSSICKTIQSVDEENDQSDALKILRCGDTCTAEGDSDKVIKKRPWIHLGNMGLPLVILIGVLGFMTFNNFWHTATKNKNKGKQKIQT